MYLLLDLLIWELLTISTSGSTICLNLTIHYILTRIRKSQDRDVLDIDRITWTRPEVRLINIQ